MLIRCVIPLVSTYRVGFSVARSYNQGDARAFQGGTSDRSDSHAFLYISQNELLTQAVGSRLVIDWIMKKLLLCILSLLPTFIEAQDVIVKKDGSTIISKILEVNSSEVKYKKYSNLDGPVFVINKSEIQVINYENGDKEDLGNNNPIRYIEEKKQNGWNTLHVQFNSSVFDPKDGISKNLMGASVGYSHAFSLINSSPVFIEPGIAFQYLLFSKNVSTADIYHIGKNQLDDEVKDKMELLSFKLPINVIYKFELPNTRISIAPFLGIILKINVSANEKTIHSEELKNKINHISQVSPGFSKFKNADGFDENLLKENALYEEAWKVFQLGWQAGVNAYFGEHIMAGVSYGTDFMEVTKGAKFINLSVSVGYVF